MTSRVRLRTNEGRLFAYSGPCLLAVDHLGRLTGGGVEGFYVDNTRIVARLAILVEGEDISPFAASTSDGNRLLRMPSSRTSWPSPNRPFTWSRHGWSGRVSPCPARGELRGADHEHRGHLRACRR
jgi:hypothetical protein